MTGNRTTELLPCPFCGGEVELKHRPISGSEDKGWFVRCKCSARIGLKVNGIGMTKAEAIAAWNTRAELGSDIKPCPWCGRDMDKRSEADKDNAGHTWYRDDSDYIQCLIRSNEFMKKERVTHGTLTAEQVRHASHGHYKLRMVLDVDGFDVPQVTFDWQAIADELNAMLGSDDGTRWHELFGTPERAAWTLANACAKCDDNFPCCECPLSEIIGSNVYEPELLEWLESEVRDD